MVHWTLAFGGAPGAGWAWALQRSTSSQGLHGTDGTGTCPGSRVLQPRRQLVAGRWMQMPITQALGSPILPSWEKVPYPATWNILGSSQQGMILTKPRKLWKRHNSCYLGRNAWRIQQEEFLWGSDLGTLRYLNGGLCRRHQHAGGCWWPANLFVQLVSWVLVVLFVGFILLWVAIWNI